MTKNAQLLRKKL